MEISWPLMFRERWEYVQPTDALAKVFEDGADMVVCPNCGAWLLIPTGLPMECDCSEVRG